MSQSMTVQIEPLFSNAAFTSLMTSTPMTAAAIVPKHAVDRRDMVFSFSISKHKQPELTSDLHQRQRHDAPFVV